MLANLVVQDIVLIEKLSIDFAGGLTVLTGETGAGKSILLDALSLALGSRGDSALVRAGAQRGQVTAVFDLPSDHPVLVFLADSGMECDGTTLILRRMQGRDGKARALINDQACSVALLRQVGAMLVEIHGQHDDRALVSAQEHRRLLDAFGRLEPDCAGVAARFRALRSMEAEAAKLRAALVASEREADYLRGAVDDLEALSPEPGEEARLAERRHFLMRVEKGAVELNEAYEMIGGNASPVPQLVGLSRRLERKAADLPELLAGPLAALNAALDHLEEARRGLQEAIRGCDFDPAELERTEERLFALRAAGRKYQVAIDDLPAIAAECANRLAELDLGGERLGLLEGALAGAGADYRASARQLSEGRAAAAGVLAAAVNAELPALKLEAARFSVAHEVDPAAVTPDGYDRIAFHVRTNPGTEPGPLLKVASGGELSRFLLALKVALADRGSAPTLIFDEIDSGAGGAVAEAIGRRLARLAGRVQVVAVTHAPQVAAHAGAHLRISKADVEGGARVLTSVEPVAGSERREEIARMLAGATVSEEARAAAERLMAGAA